MLYPSFRFHCYSTPRAEGTKSAPPGWILERGPVDPKPLKLGIYGTVPRDCVGGGGAQRVFNGAPSFAFRQ